MHGSHFFWLFELLRTQSTCALTGSASLYLLIVLYFSLLTGCWFLSYTLVRNFLGLTKTHSLTAAFFVTAVAYFVAIEHYALSLFGRVEGYPFLNPFIPLARYRWFCILLASVSSVYFPGQTLSESYRRFNKSCDLTYIEPLVNRAMSKEERALITPAHLAQRVYHQLTSAVSKQKNSNDYEKIHILCAPESAFPFAINDYNDDQKLWNAALYKNSIFLIGTVYEYEKKVYQSVAFLRPGFKYLHSCPIMQIYVKKHKIPLCEYLPKFTKKILKGLSNSRHSLFDLACNLSRGKPGIGVQQFILNDQVIILPQICSEFFCTSRIVDFLAERRHAGSDKQFVIFLFINDSWFIPSFRELMQTAATLKAACIQMPTVYVGHFGYKQLLR
ncbi:MAG: hypothetical protein H6679_04795 [Epsilonproteobacteria bacterium]|nr:hypothetical protein [Campylobacterota bacterium]